ncbi:hypothetical protein LSH36_1550g00004 [Paralvinella palmiformis]|uniref:Uncharacterized protein n=1 Tax=Paralvinella palmiformis TaxID=53620 RepID=A0AAD9MR35_9ANNE|nr:hypothetical protein LSH36_1550g00004 [Paralvinella palmiformis]
MVSSIREGMTTQIIVKLFDPFTTPSNSHSHVSCLPNLLLTHVKREKTVEEETVMMAITMVSPTSDLSHLEGLIAVDDSDTFTIARLEAELEKKNKIIVANAVHISQLKPTLKIERFELECFIWE